MQRVSQSKLVAEFEGGSSSTNIQDSNDFNLVLEEIKMSNSNSNINSNNYKSNNINYNSNNINYNSNNEINLKHSHEKNKNERNIPNGTGKKGTKLTHKKKQNNDGNDNDDGDNDNDEQRSTYHEKNNTIKTTNGHNTTKNLQNKKMNNDLKSTLSQSTVFPHIASLIFNAEEANKQYLANKREKERKEKREKNQKIKKKKKKENDTIQILSETPVEKTTEKTVVEGKKKQEYEFCENVEMPTNTVTSGNEVKYEQKKKTIIKGGIGPYKSDANNNSNQKGLGTAALLEQSKEQIVENIKGATNNEKKKKKKKNIDYTEINISTSSNFPIPSTSDHAYKQTTKNIYNEKININSNTTTTNTNITNTNTNTNNNTDTNDMREKYEKKKAKKNKKEKPNKQNNEDIKHPSEKKGTRGQNVENELNADMMHSYNKESSGWNYIDQELEKKIKKKMYGTDSNSSSISSNSSDNGNDSERNEFYEYKEMDEQWKKTKIHEEKKEQQQQHQTKKKQVGEQQTKRETKEKTKEHGKKKKDGIIDYPLQNQNQKQKQKKQTFLLGEKNNTIINTSEAEKEHDYLKTPYMLSIECLDEKEKKVHRKKERKQENEQSQIEEVGEHSAKKNAQRWNDISSYGPDEDMSNIRYEHNKYSNISPMHNESSSYMNKKYTTATAATATIKTNNNYNYNYNNTTNSNMLGEITSDKKCTLHMDGKYSSNETSIKQNGSDTITKQTANNAKRSSNNSSSSSSSNSDNISNNNNNNSAKRNMHPSIHSPNVHNMGQDCYSIQIKNAQVQQTLQKNLYSSDMKSEDTTVNSETMSKENLNISYDEFKTRNKNRIYSIINKEKNKEELLKSLSTGNTIQMRKMLRIMREFYIGFIGIQLIYFVTHVILNSSNIFFIQIFSLTCTIFSLLDANYHGYVLNGFVNCIIAVLFLLVVLQKITGFENIEDNTTLSKVTISNVALLFAFSLFSFCNGYFIRKLHIIEKNCIRNVIRTIEKSTK